MSALDRLRALPDLQGSTRSAALLRIGLVVLIWTRLAWPMRPAQALTDPERLAMGLLFFGSTSAMLVGFHTRIASALTAVSMLLIYYWFGFYRGEEPWTHHHVYILVIASVLVALTPSGGSYSLDRWREVRAAEAEGRPPTPERGWMWGLVLIRVQLSALYFWTAFDKTDLAFLSGERLEAVFMTIYLGSDPPAIPAFHALCVIMAVSTVLLEYALAFAPWFARWRTPVLLAGVVFHAIIYYSLPVATFTGTMWLLYLAWYPPDQVHDVLDRLQGATIQPRG
ncbi:MAG: HTTM domain-containing protein [Alphaproteobacteria bacterium]|nr:HTTM domain-containing protein [Alphaproteobacteria bacterium]